jgi:hypothetical protein
MEYLQSWVGKLGSSQRLLLVLAVAAAAPWSCIADQAPDQLLDGAVG